jgi:hypothetical protein
MCSSHLLCQFVLCKRNVLLFWIYDLWIVPFFHQTVGIKHLGFASFISIVAVVVTFLGDLEHDIAEQYFHPVVEPNLLNGFL